MDITKLCSEVWLVAWFRHSDRASKIQMNKASGSTNYPSYQHCQIGSVEYDEFRNEQFQMNKLGIQSRWKGSVSSIALPCPTRDALIRKRCAMGGELDFRSGQSTFRRTTPWEGEKIQEEDDAGHWRGSEFTRPRGIRDLACSPAENGNIAGLEPSITVTTHRNSDNSGRRSPERRRSSAAQPSIGGHMCPTYQMEHKTAHKLNGAK